MSPSRTVFLYITKMIIFPVCHLAEHFPFMSLGRTYSLYITKPNIFLYVIDSNIHSVGNGVEYFSCIYLAEHFPSPSLYTIEYYISAQHFQFVVLNNK
jgi:hypothetical protein